MKRSDIIHKLADILTEQRKDLDNGTDWIDADNILTFLEKEGMLPDTIRYNSVDEYENINETEILCDNDISFAWEPETHEFDENGLNLNGN